MADGSTTPEEIKPGQKFGYARSQFEPKIKEAGDILTQSGIEPGTPEFRKARKGVSREFYRREAEGEIDNLTGLLNRTGFERRLSETLGTAKREGHPLAVLSIDVNGLKPTNDTLGHKAGDQLLIDVATVIKNNGRPGDILVRYGGDEFLLLLPSADLAGGKHYGERLLQALHENEEGKAPLSASLGISEVDLENPKLSIDDADKAMYKAKRLYKETGISTPQTTDDLAPGEKAAALPSSKL